MNADKIRDLGHDFTDQMVYPRPSPYHYTSYGPYYNYGGYAYGSGDGGYYTAPEEYEYEYDMPYEEYGPEYYGYGGGGGGGAYSDNFQFGGAGMGIGGAQNQYNISYANRQRNNPDAYEAATGQNNIGLDVALRKGMNGIIGQAGQAGLEGGLGQGDNSNTMRTNPIEDTAMKNMDMIFNHPAHSNNSCNVRYLGLDKANNTIGGILGAASLNGNGGISGAAGLGKIMGNQPGIGPNTGAIMGIAASEGINGSITMAPEDLGNESKESLGATPKIASAAKAGLSVGTKAAMDAGIGDKKAAETLAGLGEGMATGNALDEQNYAMKALGVEGAATSVSGYMGTQDAADHGSLASYLGIGPSGEAAKVAALGKGAKGAEDVDLAIKQNQIKMILDLNRRNHKEKEDIIENTLKINSLKKDLNDLP